MQVQNSGKDSPFQESESLDKGIRKKISRKKKRKRKKKISKRDMEQNWKIRKYRFGMLFFGIVLVCAILFISGYYIRQKSSEEMYRSLRREEGADFWMRTDLIKEPEAELKEDSAVEAFLRRENTIDFEELEEMNPDVYAWIEIPGTKVDYPILQHPDDDSYYLNHTMEKVTGLPGSIYSESVHPKDFSAIQTVLYGHNMKNDTMFGSLHDYEDGQKLQECPYIYIYLKDRTLLYRIFAAVSFSDAYLPVYCDYEEESSFIEFVNEIRCSPGQKDMEIEVPYGSRLLTLSTCIANDVSHRFLVEAVYVGEYEKE